MSRAERRAQRATVWAGIFLAIFLLSIPVWASWFLSRWGAL